MIHTIFAEYDGIVSFREFKRRLGEMGCWTSPKSFYPLIKRVGAKKFRVALQKPGQTPRQVRPETYYVSPAFNPIDTALAFYRVMHNFIMEHVKNFLRLTCHVKDVARLDQKTGDRIITDLRVEFGSRKLYVEFTSGGWDEMRDQLRKIKDSPTREIVFLVGLEHPPRRVTDSTTLGVTSNKLDALKLADKLEMQVQVFSLTNLTELESYCREGKVSYAQR